MNKKKEEEKNRNKYALDKAIPFIIICESVRVERRFVDSIFVGDGKINARKVFVMHITSLAPHVSCADTIFFSWHLDNKSFFCICVNLGEFLLCNVGL